jgi:hypothetical protein
VHESLVIAVVIAGILRVLSANIQGLARGVCDSRELMQVHAAVWVSLVVGAIAGLAFGGLAGLTALVYGVAAGWALRCVLVYRIARRRIAISAT